MSAPRASQLSGSTAFAGSSASLSSLGGPTPGQNGSVTPTANIINQKADASRSLYQICITLKNRLAQVPDFEPYLEQLDPNDPVDALWNLLRTGYPLLTVYNALQPTTPLKVDENASEAKKSKIAIFKFVKACMDELKVPPKESFVVTDLMGNDTSGFVKVRMPLLHEGFHSKLQKPESDLTISISPSLTRALFRLPRSSTMFWILPSSVGYYTNLVKPIHWTILHRRRR